MTHNEGMTAADYNEFTVRFYLCHPPHVCAHWLLFETILGFCLTIN